MGTRDLEEKVAPQEALVSLVRGASLAQLVHLEIPADRDHRDSQDQRGHQALGEIQAPLDQQASLVARVSLFRNNM